METRNVKEKRIRLLDSNGQPYPGVGSDFGESPKEIFVRTSIYNVTSMNMEVSIVASR